MNSILFLSAALLLFGGMVLTPAEDETEIKVSIGCSEFVAGTALKVRFLEVLEDSRCPEGVDCIWAGNARIRIEVIRDYEAGVLYEIDTNGPAPFVDFDRHRITLKALDPYPRADVSLNKSDYKATLTIAESK